MNEHMDFREKIEHIERLPQVSFDHGYALLIGVGTTADPRWSLPVTVKDVQAIHAILTDPALCAYPKNENHVRLLCNADATRTRILDEMRALTLVIAKLGGDEAIVKLFHAIQDVGRWWP
jgi:hypothetical protein